MIGTLSKTPATKLTLLSSQPHLANIKEYISIEIERNILSIHALNFVIYARMIKIKINLILKDRLDIKMTNRMFCLIT